MSQHTRYTTLLALAGLALTVAATGARAQLNDTDLRQLAEQGQADEWTFSVGRNSVTHKPLTAICNLQEPAEWQAIGRFKDPLGPETGAVALPTSWDWRSVGGCTSVKNQASCGSCWAFGTVGAMESAILINDGVTTDLSEQYLVSCNLSGWSCSGGWFAHDYHWDTAGADGGGIGAVLEAAKPYTATNQACGGPFAHPYALNSWYYVSSSGGVPSTAAIKQAILLYGPVSVAVYVNNAFQAYSSGVFNACANGTVNHAVVLVGWNDAQQAWILRNSWGSGWGESGYMRIRYGCSKVGYAACYVDYGTGNPGASMLTPLNYATLEGASVEFTWEAADGASEYWLGIGTTAGKCNLYSASQGTDTSVTVDRLPTDGKPLYVKLYTRIDGQWYARPYVYTAASVANAAAEMISPADGSTLESGTATFTWSTGDDVKEYKLWIGTAVGTSNLYCRSQGQNTSVTVTNLPCNGRTLYVRLWSRFGASTWLRNNYTYTAASVAPEAAVMTTPANGSELDSSSVTFAWDEGTGATEYYLYVGTAAGAKNLVNRAMGKARTLTVNGLPTNGSTLYVRLLSKIDGTWQYNDYTYVTPNLVRGAAEMISPENGATLGSESVSFEWSEGVGATQYWLKVGTAVGGGNLYSQSQGMGQSVTIDTLPTNGQPVFVRLMSRIAGVYQVRDYVYTAATIVPAAAEMTSPAAGTMLSSSVVTFAWSTGTNVARYKLTIGTTLGGYNLYNGSTTTDTSVTVANLPTDGRVVYVRLWSLIGTAWQKRNYTYRAIRSEISPAAEMTSPVNGSKFTSTTVTFSWTTGLGASEYWLSISSSPGENDIHNHSIGTSRSHTVTGLPSDGRTLYVRLSTLCYGVWEYRDYTYRAKGP